MIVYLCFTTEQYRIKAGCKFHGITFILPIRACKIYGHWLLPIHRDRWVTYSSKHQGDIRCKPVLKKYTTNERKAVLIFRKMRPNQNGRHVAEDTFKYIFLSKTFRWISIKTSLMFVSECLMMAQLTGAQMRHQAWNYSSNERCFNTALVNRYICLNLCASVVPHL